MSKGVYTVTFTGSVSAAITLIQLKAGATVPLEILRANVAQHNSTTSAMQPVILVRKSAAATVTSFTPVKTDENDGAASAAGGTSATGVNASAEGTDTDVVFNDAFNVLNGWLYLPVPEERIKVLGAGIIGLKFADAPSTALSVRATVTFREL